MVQQLSLLIVLLVPVISFLLGAFVFTTGRQWIFGKPENSSSSEARNRSFSS